MLTREAFNALLKTLEEPPEHVKFIFCTTEPTKIPITVLSRCQRFDFAGIETDSIRERLGQIATAEGVEVTEDALGLLARRAAGSMRDGQSLLEQLLALTENPINAGAVHRMLDEGYLKRSPDPTDGRQALLRITAKGERLHKRILPLFEEQEAKMLDNLTSEERKLLDSLLKKLVLRD